MKTTNKQLPVIHVTEYGFVWGPVIVQRVFSQDRFGVCIELITRKQRLQVRVTPSGVIRANKDTKKDNIFRA